MDYYESVVMTYLRADRAIFMNTECCIQLKPGHNPDSLGPHSHWYCDAVAADFRSETVFLCETSYSAQLHDLIKRLREWHDNWAGICHALARESFLPAAWPVRPWLFVPEHCLPLLLKHLDQIGSWQPLNSTPRITPLEMAQPWLYCSYDRIGEAPKPSIIPEVSAK